MLVFNQTQPVCALQRSPSPSSSLQRQQQQQQEERHLLTSRSTTAAERATAFVTSQLWSPATARPAGP